MIMTPSFGARYSYLDTQSYVESGAGGFNLQVNEGSVHRLELGPQINLKWDNKTEQGLFVMPEVSASYAYDIFGDQGQNVAVLQGGGGQLFLDGFEPQRHKINLGTGLSVADEIWEVKANYDFEYRGDLNIHSFALRGVYKF